MDRQRLLNTFFDLVGIDSPSRHEAGVAAYCAARLEALGFTVAIDGSCEETGADTGNLVAHLPGTAAGHIAFSAHMDCVDPCCGVEPVVREGIVYSAGDTVLGADDKAGIAAILEAVACALEAQVSRPAITVVLTVGEEQSLLGARALRPDLFDGSVPCFVLDADGSPGSIILCAPYHYTLGARIAGKAAHAGVEPECGISAIQIAARAIAHMDLGRIDKETTANIGIIEGGHAVNIVAGECTVSGECRSLSEDKVEAQREHMTRCLEEAASAGGGRVEAAWHLDYPGVSYCADDPLVVSLAAIARQVGLEPRFSVSGGGSDTNVLGTKGARAITLGIGMANFHTPDEHISVGDLEDTARFAEAIIEGFGQEKRP